MRGFTCGIPLCLISIITSVRFSTGIEIILILALMSFYMTPQNIIFFCLKSDFNDLELVRTALIYFGMTCEILVEMGYRCR
jgi:hypothetical protein